MSVRIMTAAWAVDLPAGEKLVLLALADCANDEGRCWPGLTSLGKKTGKSRRSLIDTIHALEKNGHISRDVRAGKGVNYTIHPVADEQLDLPIGSAKSAPVQKSHQCKKQHETGAKSAPKPSRTITTSEANASGGDAPSVDPAKILFDLGVSIFTEAGHSEKQARSLVGKYRKAAKSDGEVVTAFLECRQKAISSPVEWLEKRLRGARYVSASGYEYRGSDEDIMREARRRNDNATYWLVSANARQVA